MKMLHFLTCFIVLLAGLTIPIFSLKYLLDNKGEHISFGWFLENTSIYLWMNLGTVSAVVFSMMGAGIGIYTAGVSIIGSGVKVHRIKTKNLICVIFCEAVAVYGLVTALVISGRAFRSHYESTEIFSFNGFIIFGIGLSVGLVNLFTGIALGIVGSGAALAEAANAATFVEILTVQIFISAISFFSLIHGIYMGTNIFYEALSSIQDND